MECTPELKPLVDWLESRERFEPCPASLLPADLREHLEHYEGPADTYNAVIGSWAGPAMEPHKVLVESRGREYECLIGKTKAECIAYFTSLCFPDLSADENGYVIPSAELTPPATGRE